jgi:hypothetical protein
MTAARVFEEGSELTRGGGMYWLNLPTCFRVFIVQGRVTENRVTLLDASIHYNSRNKLIPQYKRHGASYYHQSIISSDPTYAPSMSLHTYRCSRTAVSVRYASISTYGVPVFGSRYGATLPVKGQYCFCRSAKKEVSNWAKVVYSYYT